MVFSSEDGKSAEKQKGSRIGGTKAPQNVQIRGNAVNRRNSPHKVQLILQLPIPMPDGFLISTRWEMRTIKLEKPESLVSELTLDIVEGRVKMLK